MEGHREFTADDLEFLNAALRVNPHLAQATRLLKQISSASGFPLNSRDELAKALAEHRELPFGEGSISVEEALELMPNYYFPIESDEDFMSKIADIRHRIEHPDGLGLAMRWAKEVKEPAAGESPPEISHEAVLERAGFRDGMGPAAGSLGERG